MKTAADVLDEASRRQLKEVIVIAIDRGNALTVHTTMTVEETSNLCEHIALGFAERLQLEAEHRIN